MLCYLKNVVISFKINRETIQRDNIINKHDGKDWNQNKPGSTNSHENFFIHYVILKANI